MLIQIISSVDPAKVKNKKIKNSKGKVSKNKWKSINLDEIEKLFEPKQIAKAKSDSLVNMRFSRTSLKPSNQSLTRAELLAGTSKGKLIQFNI